jgi:hypothetical protein
MVLADPSLETLTTEIDSLVNASMADSTWKTYKTAVESFQSFRKLYNLKDTWPTPLYDLLFYIACMSHTGLSASTITLPGSTFTLISYFTNAEKSEKT